MLAYRISTLEQAAAQAQEYQQHGYYDYSSYYQQAANVAGLLVYKTYSWTYIIKKLCCLKMLSCVLLNILNLSALILLFG